MKIGISAVIILFAVSSWAFASTGDGEGRALVTLGGDTIEVVGECSDWAFRSGMGVPNLSIDATLDDSGTNVIFDGAVRLNMEGAFWSTLVLAEFVANETGYTLSGLFTNAHAPNDPKQKIAMAVTCG